LNNGAKIITLYRRNVYTSAGGNMAVILSGDFHGGGFGEAEVLKTKYLGGFCSLHGIKLPDIHYHIILGDGGAL
jgi:hypothetical protein